MRKILYLLFIFFISFNLYGLPVNISGIVYTDEGVTPIGSNKMVSISINGAPAVASNTTDAAGAYLITGVTLSNGPIALYIDNEVEKGVTIQYINSTNDDVISPNGDVYEDHLKVSGSPSMTFNNINDAGNNGDTDITVIYSNQAAVSIVVNNGKSLLVQQGSSISFSSKDLIIGTSGTSSHLKMYGNILANRELIVRGNMTVTGGFFSGFGNITVDGTFNQTAGTIANSGTNTFNDGMFLSAGAYIPTSSVNFFNGLVSITGGTITMGIAMISSNWTDAGVSSGGILSTVVNGNSLQTIQSSSVSFNNTVIDKGTSDLNVIGSWSNLNLIVSNVGNINTGNVVVKSNFTHTDATPLTGTGILVMAGPSGQTITLSTPNALDLDLFAEKTGGQVTMAGNYTFDAANQDVIVREGTLSLNGQNITVNGAGGSFVVEDGGNLALNGTEIFTIPTLNTGSTISYVGTGPATLPIGLTSYHHLTFDESGTSDPVFTFPDANILIGGTLSVEDAVVLFDDDKNITAGALLIGEMGVFSNIGTGDFTLGGDVANAGVIGFDSSDAVGNGIQIRSTSSTLRNWQGSGTFLMTNVDVSYQAVLGNNPPFIIAEGNDSLNNVRWVFDGDTNFVIPGTQIEVISITPNPLIIGSGTSIEVKKDELVEMSLVILDINGRVQLEIEDTTPFNYNSTFLFDGRDRKGRILGRGLYLIYPKVEGSLLRKKLRKLYVKN